MQNGFTFLVLACLGCPGKEAVKRVCVCLLNSKKTQSQVSGVVSKNRHKQSSSASVRSPVVDEERMSPGHWLGSVLQHCCLGDWKDIYLSFGQGSSLLWTHTLRPFIAGPLR